MTSSTNGHRDGIPVSASALFESPSLESGIEIKNNPAWLKGDPALQAEGGLADFFGIPSALTVVPAGRSRDELRARPVRLLTLMFRRNHAHDGHRERVRYEGYHICWPDGRPVSIGFQRFCQLGSRLLGLGRKMESKEIQLVEVGFHEVDGLESPLTRLSNGIRTRRLYLERHVYQGRLFFFNGTPTDLQFDERCDDPRVLNWLGWHSMRPNHRRWFDLSAGSVP